MRQSLILTIFLAALLAGCKPEATDYRQAAIEQYIIRQTGSDAKVSFDLFEVIDSTTYAAELEHRQKVFEIKKEQDTKLLIEYSAKGMRNNTIKKQFAARNDVRVLAALDSLAGVIAPYATDIAYYDCHFSGRAKTGDLVTEFVDYYACVTPSGEVMCVLPTSKGLHSTLGRVLPGYLDLVKSSEDE